MKGDSTHYDTLFDRSLSKINDENDTMYFEIERQISSPRVKRLHHSSTIRNWNSSMRFFEPVLKSFSADDLLIDGMFEEFLKENYGKSNTEASLQRTGIFARMQEMGMVQRVKEGRTVHYEILE